MAVQSSVGYRFGDGDWAESRPNACEGAPYVCYPRGFGRIGKAVLARWDSEQQLFDAHRVRGAPELGSDEERGSET